MNNVSWEKKKRERERKKEGRILKFNIFLQKNNFPLAS